MGRGKKKKGKDVGVKGKPTKLNAPVILEVMDIAET